MLLEGIVSFKCRLMHVQIYAYLMKKQKENSHEGITWSEMGKQNVQAEKVYCFVTLLGYIIYIILTFAHLGGC